MTEPGKTTLVIPCYQEALRLPTSELSSCLGERPWLQLLMVDDGSTDGTGSALAALADLRPEQVRILTLASNRGKGEAVRRGLLRALEGDACYVGYWDADLATPLEEVDDFVCYLEEHPELNLLYGSRVLLLGRQIDRRPLRHYGGRIMATLASIVLSLPVYDTQCGAKVMRARSDLRELLEAPFLTRWMFDVELLARWRARPGGAAHDVHELPVQRWRDVAGSKLRWQDFVTSPWELWRIARHYSAAAPGASSGVPSAAASSSSDTKRLR